MKEPIATRLTDAARRGEAVVRMLDHEQVDHRTWRTAMRSLAAVSREAAWFIRSLADIARNEDIDSSDLLRIGASLEEGAPGLAEPADGWEMPEGSDGASPLAMDAGGDGWLTWWGDPDAECPSYSDGAAIQRPFEPGEHATADDLEALGFTIVG